jgi:hypothetical protein
MVIKPVKFYDNKERLDYLRALFASASSADNKEGLKLAWMWLTTEVFDRRTFEQLLEVYASTKTA